MLSDHDKVHLGNYEKRLTIIKERTRQVAKFANGVRDGARTGYYIHGGPGTGKTHHIMEELNGQGINFIVHKGRMTGKGLFLALSDNPDSVHYLDDIANLFKQDNALNVLLAAMDPVDPDNRFIKWTTATQTLTCHFRGAVIASCNRDLGTRVPELAALGSRIPVLLFDPPQEELWAVGRSISEQGWGPLSPDVCRDICEYIIGECKGSEYRFDLRLLTSAFTDYIHCLEKDALCRWQDLVDSTIAKTVLAQSKAEELEQQRHIALDIHRQGLPTEEKLRLWRERSGKGKDAYYARIKELKARGGMVNGTGEPSESDSNGSQQTLFS